MNTKHTPGPWSHATHTKQTTLAAHERIAMPGACAAGVWSMGCDRETVLATARLIAAAPELLEALEKLCAIDDIASWAPEWDVARAAIAKATGG